MKAAVTDSCISIKPFVREDWHALWSIRLAQLAEHDILLEPAAIPERPRTEVDENDPEWDFHHIDRVYVRGAGNFWIAWHRDCPIGYVGGQDVGGAIELRRMYVMARYRRRGAGTSLVGALIAHSRNRGIHAIELWTAADGPGRKLYHSLGFREVAGPGPEYWDVISRARRTPGAEEIRMRLGVSNG